MDGLEWFKKDNTNYRIEYKPVVNSSDVNTGINNSVHNAISFIWNGTLGAILESGKSINNYFAGGYKEPTADIFPAFYQWQDNIYKYHTRTSIGQQIKDFGEVATDLQNYELPAQLFLGDALFGIPQSKLVTSPLSNPKIESAFLGGAKKDLLSSRNILEGNHLPTMDGLKQAGFKMSYGKGSAMQMLYEEHQAFISTGSSNAAKAFRKKEAGLLSEGKFMEAFDLNSQRLQSAFGEKYNSAIKEARDYYQKEILPELQKQYKKKN